MKKILFNDKFGLTKAVLDGRKTQQYKMAGNSIVVDVLYHIFRKLFVDKCQESRQLTLF